MAFFRISYPPYQQDIYKEHPDISSLTLEAIGEVRDSLQLQTTGKQVPRPVASFTHVKDSLPRVCIALASSSCLSYLAYL